MRVPLLDGGRVGNAVTDLASAARSGLAPTGHAHIAREETPAPRPGEHHDGRRHHARTCSPESSGACTCSGSGTSTSSTPRRPQLTGGSRDACFLVEDGRLTQPVAPARFSESVFGALERVDAIGADVLAQPLMNVWNGCVSAPAIRVRGFRVRRSDMKVSSNAGTPGDPGAVGRGVAGDGRPPRLPGRPGRHAVRAAGDGRRHPGHAPGRPGDGSERATTSNRVCRSDTAMRAPTTRCSTSPASATP